MTMTSYFLYAFAILFVSGGVFYAVKIFQGSKEEETAVPISNPIELQKFKNEWDNSQKGTQEEGVQEDALSFSEQSQDSTHEPKVPFFKERQSAATSNQDQPHSSSGNVTSHILRENLQSSQSSDQGNIKPHADAKSQLVQEELSHLKKEFEEFKSDAHRRQTTLIAENKRLQESLQTEISKTSSQVTNEDEAISRLEQQEKEIAELRHALTKNKEIEDRFDLLKKSHQELTAKYDLFKKHKENELFQLQNEIEHERTKGENSHRLSDELEQLKKEKRQLETEVFGQLKEAEMRNKEYEIANKAYQDDFEKQKAQIEELKKKLRQSSDELKGQFSQKIEHAEKVNAQLKAEKDRYVQLLEKLQVDYNKLRDYNQDLLEKEQLLQYELTKQRAQSLGLEKICEDFEVKLSDA